MADVVLLGDLIDFEYISSARLENVSRVYIVQIRLSRGQVSRLKWKSL